MASINPIFKSPVDISNNVGIKKPSLFANNKNPVAAQAIFDFLKKFMQVPQRQAGTPQGSLTNLGIGNLNTTNIGGFNVPQIQGFNPTSVTPPTQGMNNLSISAVPKAGATFQGPAPTPINTQQQISSTPSPTDTSLLTQAPGTTQGELKEPTKGVGPAQGFLNNEQISKLKASGLSDIQINQLNQATALQDIFNQETPEQKIQREGLQTSLGRLISLQEQLVQAGAPNETLQQLDEAIAGQSKALKDLTPGKFLETQKGLKDVGITQSQLEREVAARREPIAGALSDLLMSRSLLGQQIEAKQQFLASQAAGIGQQLELQQAINSLVPKRGIPGGIQEKILGNIFEAPKRLSVAEAKALGVPFGTTIEQAAALGKIPTGAKGAVKLPAAQIEDLATMDTASQLAQQALDLGQRTGFAGTGGLFTGSLKQYAAMTLGVGSKEAQDLRNLIGNIKGTIAKLRGGTSFTENEEALLNSYVPTINDSSLVISSKLQSLQSFISLKRNAVLNLAQGNIELAGAEDDQTLEALLEQFNQ